jgi:CRISPR-associated protein Csb2
VATALAFRFPLGEYHATAWDRAVNTGESEWPPSAWRIVRALLSTWHTRCPQLDANAVERVVRSLAVDPPTYLLPDATPSHTRHYLPGVGYTATVRDTAYTLAPRLQLDPQAQVVVLWPTLDLDPDDRHALGALLKALPYLGRADSVCEATLLEPSEVPGIDEHWSVPADSGDELRVLVPMPQVTREQLEVTPDAMRKARRLVPEGARWQGYRRGVVPDGVAVQRPLVTPTAVRWALGGAVETRDRQGVQATSGLRRSVLGVVRARGLDTSDHAWLLAGGHGQTGVSDRHRHAHWLWFTSPDRVDTVREVALWVTDGIPAELLGAVLGIGRLARFVDPPKGYVAASVHLQSVGQVEQVLPDLAASSRRWATRTPMLTDRHPKRRRTVDEFVRRELERELSYRDWEGVPAPALVAVHVHEAWDRESIRQYRRYRWNESMAERRRGFHVTFEVDRAVRGPVSLGALSHLGFGLFEPV